MLPLKNKKANKRPKINKAFESSSSTIDSTKISQEQIISISKCVVELLKPTIEQIVRSIIQEIIPSFNNNTTTTSTNQPWGSHPFSNNISEPPLQHFINISNYNTSHQETIINKSKTAVVEKFPETDGDNELLREIVKDCGLGEELDEKEIHRHASKLTRQLRKQIRIYYNEKDKKMISRGKSSVHKYFKTKFKPIIQIPTLFDKNGNPCRTDFDKCNAMALTFQKAFIRRDFSNLFTVSYSTKFGEKISDIDFNVLDVFNLLRKLPSKNSTSPDSIPYILLKKCAFTLSPVISDLFRLILDEGEIPEIWQKSIIIPLFKKGDRTLADNYRPISLTSTICRVFERLLAEKLIDFLNLHDFFCVDQFGFLRKRSTVTQLLTMLDQIYSCVDKGNKVDIVYIDFEKAFDTVPIELLIQKIKYIGIDGKILRFLIHFLSNRKFKVGIEQDFSDEYVICSACPARKCSWSSAIYIIY
uniref:Reverse transcriptase domain-containing protein n=1 Tax=Meloidogyne hapla TaxID=6305 RepID=A0A1I8C1E2_MELHA